MIPGQRKRSRDEFEQEGEHRRTPLNMNVAGVPCLPYARCGAHEGFGHASHPAETGWRCERYEVGKRSEEDVAFLECVMGFPINRCLVDKLPGHPLSLVGMPVRSATTTP